MEESKVSRKRSILKTISYRAIGLGHPIDVAIDSQARVYASDENNGQILIYALTNQIPNPPPDSACTGTGGRNAVITGT